MGWRSRAAKAQLTLNVVRFLGGAGTGGIFLGGVALFLGTDAPWQILHEPWMSAAGLVLMGVGFLFEKGAAYVRADGEDKLDTRTALLLSAALRATHASDAKQMETAIQPVLSHVVSLAQHVCGTNGELFAVLLVPSSGAEALHVRAYSSFRGDHAPEASIPMDGQTPGAAEAARTLSVQYIADNSKNPAFEGKEYRCMLSFPLVRRDQCNGVISLDSTLPGHFDGHLEELDALVRPLVEVVGVLLQSIHDIESCHEPV